ncbi:hypothetical protein GC175_09335 [bacterium]|nr:hypothetical protein [bacterium]
MSRAYHETVARERYIRNVRKAQMQDLLGLITGTNTNLVNFEEVAKRLKIRQEVGKHLETVSVQKIVGSLGRYHDFTREFLPRNHVNSDRWASLDAALNALENVPPVELYKIGDVYFVQDGNHRVSVARANKIDIIEAYVTELASPIVLTLNDFERDRWIIKMEYVDFLERTRLDVLRPGVDLMLTVPGQYPLILKHIEVHGYLQNMELDRQGASRRLGPSDIVMSWYDSIYLPVIEAIRHYDLMPEFPDRTEADLYLWITKHREKLAERYHLAPLSAETAVATFAELYSDRPVKRTIKGLRKGLQRTLGNGRPLGMSAEEFAAAKARRAAGEMTLLEAEKRLNEKEQSLAEAPTG